MKFLVCFIGLLLGLGNKADAQQCASMADIKKVHVSLRLHGIKTVRFSPEDTGTLIGLPYRYTVPSMNDSFQEMYYWDTFFTGEGLIADGYGDLAQSNVENMLYMVERYGKMLNRETGLFLKTVLNPHI